MPNTFFMTGNKIDPFKGLYSVMKNISHTTESHQEIRNSPVDSINMCVLLSN